MCGPIDIRSNLGGFAVATGNLVMCDQGAPLWDARGPPSTLVATVTTEVRDVLQPIPDLRHAPFR
jgi:hypothetical protein